ncbi:Extracellular serine protease precursor [compost metagenome]
MSGTSMSTPYVSGVAALLLSLYPQMTPAQVKARLESTADDVGLPGFDTYTGHGRINAARALGLQ